MKVFTAQKREPLRFSLESDPKQWVALVVMFLLIFVFPIFLVDWMNSQPATSEAGSQVLGISTDNVATALTSGIDLQAFLVAIGVVVMGTALLLLYFLFKDFRKREDKYSF